MTIRWAADYASALQEAKTNDKLLYVDFFSPT